MLELVLGLKLLLVVVCVLLSVAFMTLFERKALSYLQERKGPNKWGWLGLLQPFSDAVKLFSKEVMFFSFSNPLLYYLSPMVNFMVALLVWIVYPSSYGVLSVSMTVIFILCCISVSVYPILGAGWASNSKFSFLGSLRAVAQTISYEVSFAIIILSLIAVSGSFKLESFTESAQYNLIIALPLGLVYLISILAETNRTPLDLSESESELVSGFNTEFSAGKFALFFLAEYSSILFMSVLFVLFFLSSKSFDSISVVKITAVVFVFLWVRGTLPRLRYDKLMMLAWKLFLPLALSYLMASLALMLFIFA